ncbi:MAG: glycerophosphodiester phosphodiesterase [Clostridia bacterium]|nr:glycerophosphodiester phosphodiesterase [Clostridia bacterium]
MIIAVLIVAALLLVWLYMIKPRLRRPAALKELKKAQYAHRGLHNIQKGIPENSLPAFRLAVEQGYGIELDLHLSKDGRLVVEHDDTLRRTCGVDLRIEDTDWAELQTLRLEGTEERLPLLEEILALVDGKIPLLLEVKVVDGNQAALCAALAAAMEGYQGPWCVESFEPRAILWFRRHAPRIPRGQLAGNVRKEGSNVSPVINFVLKNLLVNVLSRPDFVAYNYLSHRNLSFGLCRLLYRPPLFFWTIRSEEGHRIAEQYHAAPIFEEPKNS